MAGQFTVEQFLAVLVDQRTVFGDIGNPVADLREEGDQLIVLVAAGDDEFNATLLKLFKLRQKPRTVIGFGVIKKSSVHICDDNFNGHTGCSWGKSGQQQFNYNVS